MPAEATKQGQRRSGPRVAPGVKRVTESWHPLLASEPFGDSAGGTARSGRSSQQGMHLLTDGAVKRSIKRPQRGGDRRVRVALVEDVARDVEPLVLELAGPQQRRHRLERRSLAQVEHVPAPVRQAGAADAGQRLCSIRPRSRPTCSLPCSPARPSPAGARTSLSRSAPVASSGRRLGMSGCHPDRCCHRCDDWVWPWRPGRSLP
jgi:hypothetical protein